MENKDTESLIQEYARRIFGFAYSKTGNVSDAEDLSQEILLTLCNKKIVKGDIGHMDAYIYRICFYTWSKYLRKNKPHWDMVRDTSILCNMFSEENIEEAYLERELWERLRKEIMYLGRIRREITVMFYYENKSGAEIAEALSIPASTVRWYLHQTKAELKERIEMKESLGIYKPVRMNAGCCGQAADLDMGGLAADILMQNICHVCYGKAQTIEEIARTLGVAAIYLEDRLDKLLYMDYMKKVGNNRYQTDFFIADGAYQYAKTRYQMEKLLPLARQFYTTVREVLPEIRKTGFLGCEEAEDGLMWNLLPFFMIKKLGRIEKQMTEVLQLESSMPIRRDGTRHWVAASLRDCDADWEAEVRDFHKRSFCHGIKYGGSENIISLQYDLSLLGGWREFEDKDLRLLKRVKNLIRNQEKPNEYEKEMIAGLIKAGYLSMKEGKLSVLIPYLDAEQQKELCRLLEESAGKNFDDKLAAGLFAEYTRYIDRYIPEFVDAEERKHYRCSFHPEAACMYLLYQNGYLAAPDEAQKKRYCTIVWEN